MLICSTRAFESPLVNAASTLSRLLGDPAGELSEWLKLGSSGPFQPCLEQREAVVCADAVDLPELLGEEVGAVEPLVGLLDAR